MGHRPRPLEDLVMMADLKFYRGKKVFVTGHTGFKGTWLSVWLHSLGAQVCGYSLAPTNYQKVFDEIWPSLSSQSTLGDVRDRQLLQQHLLDYQPDVIFHLAAQPLVRYSYQQPLETFEVNVMGTANVLEPLRQFANPCAVVIITTDKVYENYEWDYPYREVDRLGGHDPYSTSKAAAELVVSSFRKSFFHHQEQGAKICVATARAGNVIGGGDYSPDRLVPDIVSALAAASPVVVRNPQSVRPWQHVLEPLAGYLQLGAQLHKPGFDQAWNFGPRAEDTLTVEELVQLALRHWQSGTYQVASDKGQPHEARLLKLDSSLAMQRLGWKPKWNATQALEATLNWYKQHQAGAKTLDLMRSDIQSYQKA
jgi:CDP-glucose 4,6-dehydratase